MKIMKKALILLLAAAMVLSLAACGGESGGDNGNGGASGTKPAATPTPEYVYAASFKELPSGDSRTRDLQIRYLDENGFIGTYSEVVGQREPAEGEVAEYDGQFDIYETRMCRMDFQGKVTEMAYEPVRVENEHGDGADSFSGWITAMIKTDGGFLVLEEVYLNWVDAPEGVTPESDNYYDYYQYENHYYLRSLDENGKVLNSVELDLTAMLEQESYASPSRLALLPDGKVLTNGETALYVFEPSDGSFLYRVECDFEWIMNFYQLSDGQLYVCGYGNGVNGYQAMMKPYDAEKRSFGEPLEVNGDLYSAIPGNDQYLLYYTNGSNFYGYDREKKEAVKLFNWINVDVLEDDLRSFTVLPDGRILGLMAEWDNNYENVNYSIAEISKVPSSSLPEKTVLTLATEYMDWNLRRELVRFNRKSDSVRIEVLDYSEYDNYEKDYDKNGYGEGGGLTKLRTEILAGNMPDILDLNGMPTRQLAAKGLLMDLYPLLDADAELSREDVFPNVLKALEVDGKLCSLSSGFYIGTCVGASKVVGDKPGWTYQQLNEALATMPEGCGVFGVGTTRDYVLETMLSLDMSRFVDWNTGKVSFEGQEFIDLLNFVKEFPATFDWQNYEWTDDDNDFNRIRQGQQLLLNYSLSSLDDVIIFENAFGGPDSFTFIGYPTSEGVGNLLQVTSGYAISRDCKDPEAAWQFLRILLTEEYEKSWSYYFPSNRNVFEQRKKDAMTPTYVRDENGNITLDPETGEKVMETKGWSYDPVTYEDKPIYVYTPEQIARIEQLIADTVRVPDSNRALLEIVREQSQAFFAGQRTAEEVARFVQSKANIYVNEQR